MDEIKRYVILNDLQIPFEDKAVLWDLVVPFVQELRPHGVVLNGDIVDNHELSDFTKDPKWKHYDLIAERKGACRLMDALAPICKERVWIGGNHEDRFRRFQWNRIPNLVSSDMAPTFQQAFRLDDHGFSWKPYGEFVRLGKLLVTHGFLVSQASAASAKRHFDRIGTSVLVGHTHRRGLFAKRNQYGIHDAYENGCLCRLDGLGYAEYPDWHQAFAVVDVFPGGLFSCQVIPILNRKCFMYGGTLVRR